MAPLMEKTDRQWQNIIYNKYDTVILLLIGALHGETDRQWQNLTYKTTNMMISLLIYLVIYLINLVQNLNSKYNVICTHCVKTGHYLSSQNGYSIHLFL